MARVAGAYLRDEQQRLRAEQVERKHAHDYVSYVDKTSEKKIVAQLRRLLPEASFLTEEGTAGPDGAVKDEGLRVKDEELRVKGEELRAKDEELRVNFGNSESRVMLASTMPSRDKSHGTRFHKGEGFLNESSVTSAERRMVGRGVLRWVIDPLDGTTNYVHGNHPFAVSIALRTDREVLLGVVSEVSLDECFAAWKGGGAWMNGKRISVSDKPIKEALLGLELPYDADMYRETGLRLIRHFYGYAGGIRMNGSAAVALCYVACGRWDGWIERGLGQWDFMAAGLIIKEAGGKVTNYEGDPFFLNGDDIVGSNGKIQEKLLLALREKDKG